jgi:hypothetical protein
MNALRIEVHLVTELPLSKNPKNMLLRLKWLGAVIFPEATGTALQDLAAQAWCQCVGADRRVLLEALDAPEHIVHIQTDWRQVASQLQAAPSVFGMPRSYFLDNQCEVWLISVSATTPPRLVTYSNQPRSVPLGWQGPSWN